MKEKSKSNKFKLIVLTLLIVFIAISGITYAYFSIQIRGNEEASSLRMTTANMSLIYTDVQIAAGENVIPGWTQTKTLTVENDGNKTAYYNIIWRELYNEIINDELQISATCVSSVQGNTCRGINTMPVYDTYIYDIISSFHNMILVTTYSRTNDVVEYPYVGNLFASPSKGWRQGFSNYVSKGIEIEPGEIHTYTVTIEFIETGSLQNYNQGKEFYGTLNIEQGSSVVLTSQATPGIINTGDQVSIGSEEFYVVSTNSATTVLLAKYNLYVGGNVSVDDGDNTYSYTPISQSDQYYGLQNSITQEGLQTGAIVTSLARVPFSSYNYWYDEDNETIYSKYGTSSFNDIYDEDYSTAPIIYSNDPTEPASADQDHLNNYSIAYYVKAYVNRLKGMGAHNIEGRLLTLDEASSMSCSNVGNQCTGAPSWLKRTPFWLGSVFSSDIHSIYGITYTGLDVYDPIYTRLGLRPVIVVQTSDIN